MNDEKLTITLPEFDSWEDLYDCIFWDYEYETIRGFFEAIQDRFPHGVKIGHKYVQI
jgi:hypothetical protein